MSRCNLATARKIPLLELDFDKDLGYDAYSGKPKAPDVLQQLNSMALRLNDSMLGVNNYD